MLCRMMLVVALGGGAPGCAATWGLRSVESPIPLQWPYQPNPAKLTHVRSLTGVTRDTDAGSVMRAVVFGRDDEARNAFLLPVAVATGPDGRIAVADLGRRCVHLYLPGLRRYACLTGSDRDALASPVGVIFDSEARLYVTDSAGKLFAFGADGAFLFATRTAGAERLQRPAGIAYSPRTQLLYVADVLAQRVFALRPNGELAFSFGSRGEATGQFNFPTHVFRSAAGELYVTDSLNFRVQIFDEEGRFVGSFGNHGDGSGDLGMPKGVAVDRDGIVYVVDGIFDNVQLFNRQGDYLLTLGGRGTEPGEFWLPTGAFFAEDAELYVCDTYNRRVQVFRVTPGYGDGKAE